MKNNNQKILRLLAKREYQENKRRNRILIGTVAFAVWMIFCVFSLAIGKVQADYLLMVRNGGTKASTTLEDPSEEQYRKIQELAYIRSAGMETDFAATDAFLCTVLDKTAWENMQKPAYTDIHGEYPTKENEIMLSMRALKLLGVSKPNLGMVIPVTMTNSEGEEHSGDFRLSGYYTEYVDPSMGKAYGYFSKTYLDQLDLSKVSRTLLIEQSGIVDGQTVEDRLYQDIPMRDDSQQFFGGTGLDLEAVTEMVGGYDIAAVMAVVILFAAWLLIYNVLHISYGKDIRRFGLLKTPGNDRTADSKHRVPPDPKNSGSGMSLGKCGRRCGYPDGDSRIAFEDVSAWPGKSLRDDRVSSVDAGSICLLWNVGYVSWSSRCCPKNRKTFSRGIDTVYGKSICREKK